MSTGAECIFVEVEPNKWYYILESYDAPRQAWDWREYAEAYGPFTSFEAAERSLSDNHANPGGYSQMPYVPGSELDEVTAELIGKATKPRAARRWGW